MKFYLAGEWQDRKEVIDVCNPFDGHPIDTVPKATSEDVESALTAAVCGARDMAALPGYDRSLVLRKAAERMVERAEETGVHNQRGRRENTSRITRRSGPLGADSGIECRRSETTGR